METKDKSSLSFNLILGSLGLISIPFGMIRFIRSPYDTASILLMSIGFAFVIGYIYYLERKVGISNKFIWIRAIGFILVLSIFAYFFS